MQIVSSSPLDKVTKSYGYYVPVVHPWTRNRDDHHQPYRTRRTEHSKTRIASAERAKYPSRVPRKKPHEAVLRLRL